MPRFRRNFGRGVPMGGQEGIPAMKICGPFCPTTLKAAINHAERLVDVLRVQQECTAGVDDAMRSVDRYATDPHVSRANFSCKTSPAAAVARRP